jgi:hypothetical protein
MTTSTLDTPSATPPKSRSRIKRTRAQWEALVEQFKTSGVTKTAFCKQHGIAMSCFYRWQKIVAKDSASTGFIDITEPVTRATIPSAQDTSRHWQVELELGTGVTLRVRTH